MLTMQTGEWTFSPQILTLISRAKMAMEETLALEEAVEVAISLTKREETLTIVTADHSHAVNIDEMIA